MRFNAGDCVKLLNSNLQWTVQVITNNPERPTMMKGETPVPVDKVYQCIRKGRQRLFKDSELRGCKE